MATFLSYENPAITIKLNDVVCLRIPSYNTFVVEIYVKGAENPFSLNFHSEEKCKEPYEIIKKNLVFATANDNFSYIYTYDRA